MLNQVQEIYVKGFLGVFFGMGKMVFNILVLFIDVDECIIQLSICGIVVCKNVLGDYECECVEGYSYNFSLKFCEGRVVVVSLLMLERVGLNFDLVLEVLVLFDINDQVF